MDDEKIILDNWEGYSEKNELYEKLGYRVNCRIETITEWDTEIDYSTWEPSPLGVGCGEDISPPTYNKVEKTYRTKHFYVTVPDEIYNNQIYSKNKELKELNNQISSTTKELDDNHRELRNLSVKKKEMLQIKKIRDHLYQIKLTKNFLKKLFLYWKFFFLIEKSFD